MPPLPPKLIQLHDGGTPALPGSGPDSSDPDSGDPETARQLLEQVLRLQPGNIDLLASYGQLLRNTGRLHEALDTFLHILTLDPSNALICNAVGVCFQETKQPSRAIEYYLRATALRPDLAEPYNNIGVVLFHEKDFEGAMQHLQQALSLDPSYPDAYSNLALVLRNRLQYAQAIALFRKALELNPDSPEIVGGLGETLSLLCHPSAEDTLRKALEGAPDNPELHWNLALELLRRGDYRNGWQEYEWRWKRPENQSPPRPLRQPYWRGEQDQDISGATLLLYPEQGFGDILQMLRYLPLLLARRVRIILELPPPLVRLATEYANTTQGAVTVIGIGDPPPAFDWHSSLMSLPLAFRTTLDTIPPPLRLTPPRRGNSNSSSAKPAATASDSLRVGLCWAGNPAHALDRERSLALETLRPLFSIPGCSFISLQTGPAARQIESAGLPLARPPLNEFTDTAALLDTLHLVVSVDTAVAHLSASQGVPTWILLPFISDWRWLQPGVRSQNPWYPRARIFRQTSFIDPVLSTTAAADRRALWEPVVARLVAALNELVRTQQIKS